MDIQESRRWQLIQLQTRIGLHGKRMWQLPFTYLSGIALALTAASSNKFTINFTFLFFGLTFLGIILHWCLLGALEGYKRTAKNMKEVEQSLGIGQYTKCFKSHTLPYILLMIFGISLCFIGAVCTLFFPEAFNISPAS